MTVNAASRVFGEHDTRLWRLLKGSVQEAYQEADFSELKTVDCDELSARKEHPQPSRWHYQLLADSRITNAFMKGLTVSSQL